ncbi:MAG: hypothetical protein ACQEXJ_04180 [Myxococcota bacterium]
MGRTSRTQRLLRALTLSAAAAFLVVQVVGAVHFAAVEHARCEEHGEVVHASGAHDGADHAHEPGGGRDADGEHGDEHEHCSVTLGGHDGAAVRVEPAAPGLSLAWVAAHPEGTDRAILARAVYRYAPKTSPPAIG